MLSDDYSGAVNGLLEQVPELVLGLRRRIGRAPGTPPRRHPCLDLSCRPSNFHNGHISHYGQNGQSTFEILREGYR